MNHFTTTKRGIVSIFGFLFLIAFLVGSTALAATFPCDDPPTGCRGDINLNGVAFEQEDIDIFASYFEFGLAVFTINIEAQIATTDINQDGLTLSVADLVMMIRISQDIIPPDYNTADSIAGTIYSGTIGTVHEIGSYFDGEIGYLSLTYDAPAVSGYNINLLPASDGMTLTDQLNAGVLTVTFEGTIDASIAEGWNRLFEIEFTGDAPVLTDMNAVGMFGNPVGLNIKDEVILGDINVNGIAYDIGDVVLFTNYIIYGDTMLFNLPLQSLCSDVNEDGEYLTLEDYQYLFRVFTGGIPQGTPVGPEFAGQLLNITPLLGYYDHPLMTGFESTVGALRLTYYAPGATDYTITTLPAVGDLTLEHERVGDYIYILLTGDIATGNGAVSSGINELLRIDFDGEDGELVHATVAGRDGQSVDLEIGNSQAVIGDANLTNTINILDVTYIIAYLYKNGSAPQPNEFRDADANCDCQTNILDITEIIQYLYKFGAAPCSATQWMYNCSGWE